MAELDRSRPFTKAWGLVADDEPFFFQDGKEFYQDGTEVAQDVPPVDASEEEPAQETVSVEEPAVRNRGGRKKKAIPSSVEDLVESNSDESDDESHVDDLV